VISRAVRTASVRNDLKEIGRYIAQQSQSLDLAMRFLDRVDEKWELYAAHPEMGTPRTDLGPTIRCFSVGDYVIFYEPHRRGIRMLLVTHGSRDVPSVFRDRFGEPTD
jgi:toxin ParE1/3/4